MVGIDAVAGKFRSGNAVPIERAVITADEWASIVAERDKLRAIISECATAIGNGARIGTESNLEFMYFLPKEIEIHFDKLRARVAELEDVCRKALTCRFRSSAQH